ncbi:hypothetical protein LG201_01280 [Methylobacillus gramineus]|uniref:hypothetical protein n=1 Tax=Methylobacillus gramineus TaxID=755169 RepID=UPI001CFF640F|nr:hypothetical protein [Methylobacillus gramineus]MCB5183832.1 hypothetical protein [Methylobacillus gramineus]
MLPTVSLNHAQTDDHRNTWGLALLIIGSLSVVILLVSLQKISQRNSVLELDINQMQQPARGVKLSGKESKTKLEEIVAVKSVMEELSLPWQSLFTGLESLSSPDIKLVSVEPNPKQHKLRITAETSDVAIMFGYVKNLGNTPIFNDVLLLTHEYHADSTMPVRFVVEAIWVQ